VLGRSQTHHDDRDMRGLRISRQLNSLSCSAYWDVVVQSKKRSMDGIILSWILTIASINLDIICIAISFEPICMNSGLRR